MLDLTPRSVCANASLYDPRKSVPTNFKAMSSLVSTFERLPPADYTKVRAFPLAPPTISQGEPWARKGVEMAKTATVKPLFRPFKPVPPIRQPQPTAMGIGEEKILAAPPSILRTPNISRQRSAVGSEKSLRWTDTESCAPSMLTDD